MKTKEYKLKIDNKCLEELNAEPLNEFHRMMTAYDLLSKLIATTPEIIKDKENPNENKKRKFLN